MTALKGKQATITEEAKVKTCVEAVLKALFPPAAATTDDEAFKTWVDDATNAEAKNAFLGDKKNGQEAALVALTGEMTKTTTELYKAVKPLVEAAATSKTEPDAATVTTAVEKSDDAAIKAGLKEAAAKLLTAYIKSHIVADAQKPFED